MLELKSYWAGILVQREDIADELLPERVEEIKDVLKSGDMTYVHSGTTFVLEEVCVDVYREGKLHKLLQFKK